MTAAQPNATQPHRPGSTVRADEVQAGESFGAEEYGVCKANQPARHVGQTGLWVQINATTANGRCVMVDRKFWQTVTIF
jgi:hypothetical protein